MSGGSSALELKEEDIKLMVAAKVHLGSSNCNYQMSQYVYDRNSEGVHIIRLNKTWEKLLLAARAIVAIESPSDVVAIGAQESCQRATLKFAHYTGCVSVQGRFTPGGFTNQIQKGFREPRLLIVSDPKADHQPLREASAVNIPVIAFANTDSPLHFVDIAIPCNNDKYSIALMWWMLAREVRRMRGDDLRSQPWAVMMDLFLMRELAEDSQETAEATNAEAAYEQPSGDAAADADPEWGAEASLPVAGMPDLDNAGYAPAAGTVGGRWSAYEAKPDSSWN